MESRNGGMVPLDMARTHRALTLVDVAGGRGMRERLAAMGFSPGCSMRVKTNYGGPLVVDVQGASMIVGRGIASRIMVRDRE